MSASQSPETVVHNETTIADTESSNNTSDSSDSTGPLQLECLAEDDPMALIVGNVESWISHADELADDGFTRIERSCSQCPEGHLWAGNSEVVCSNCGYVDGSENRRDGIADRTTDTTLCSSREDPWTQFQTHRPGYHNSSYLRCVGGFPDRYDWVTADDIDRPVSLVEPESFYR